jgi:hypothetical protein
MWWIERNPMLRLCPRTDFCEEGRSIHHTGANAHPQHAPLWSSPVEASQHVSVDLGIGSPFHDITETHGIRSSSFARARSRGWSARDEAGLRGWLEVRMRGRRGSWGVIGRRCPGGGHGRETEILLGSLTPLCAIRAAIGWTRHRRW